MINNEKLYIGTKFFGHDSAIFIIDPDNKEIFALATERVTRYKHDWQFIVPAIEMFIERKKINPDKIKKIYIANTNQDSKFLNLYANQYEWYSAVRKHFGYPNEKDYQVNLTKYYKEWGRVRKFLSLLTSIWGIYILLNSLLKCIHPNFYTGHDRIILKQFKKIFKNAEMEIDYYDHQYCHALTAYFTSPYSEGVVFTCDGYGDGNFSRVYQAHNEKFSLIATSPFYEIVQKNKEPEIVSLGGIYEYFTELLDFDRFSDPGKVEALAAYGNFNNPLYHELISLFKINKETRGLDFDKNRAYNLFSIEYKNFLLSNFKKEDIAAALQIAVEEIIVKYLQFIMAETGETNLSLSGGVAANVKINLKIFEEVTRNLHITPAMADDGAAEGAILAKMMEDGFKLEDFCWFKQKIPYFGTEYRKAEIIECLNDHKDLLNFQDLGTSWPEIAASMLAQGKIIALFHGRMEWGPRALGNRSILADPRNSQIRDILNKQIKKRPYFQPFCPSILLEEKNRLFEESYLNKHMTCAFHMRKEFWKMLPGACHIDGTARVQFVEEKDNPNYYKVLKKLKDLTGYGVVINTSFNKHGRTIVESPQDAINDFLDTNIDYLFIEGIKVERK